MSNFAEMSRVSGFDGKRGFCGYHIRREIPVPQWRPRWPRRRIIVFRDEAAIALYTAHPELVNLGTRNNKVPEVKLALRAENVRLLPRSKANRIGSRKYRLPLQRKGHGL